MLDKLKQALTYECYQDLRYEDQALTIISATNGEIDSCETVSKTGCLARAYAGGAFNTFSFNRVEDAGAAVREVSRAACQVSDPPPFPELEKSVAKIEWEGAVHPCSVSREEKTALLKKYSRLPFEVENIVFCTAAYREYVTKKTFVNTLGSEIEQEVDQVLLAFTLVAADGQDVQALSFYVGGADDYEDILDQEERILHEAKLASSLLKAERVESGQYDVILSPDTAATLIHETIGHASEIDSAIGTGLLDNFRLGERIGPDLLTVYDDPSLKKTYGYYAYDDDGVRSGYTPLIEKGVLIGRLSSIQASIFTGYKPTGHSRSVSYDRSNIVRMGNIVIAPGESSFDEMVGSVKDGLYLCSALGGQNSGGQFILSCQYGYRIKDGRLGQLVRGVTMTGDLRRTFGRIERIGRELSLRNAGGPCGKSGQITGKSGRASTAVLLRNATIRG